MRGGRLLAARRARLQARNNPGLTNNHVPAAKDLARPAKGNSVLKTQSRSLRASSLRRLRQLFNWDLLKRKLREKRVVGLVNLFVLTVLTWQTFGMLHVPKNDEIADHLLEVIAIDDLPHPLDIAAQVRRGIFSVPPREVRRKPGYEEVRQGTFRTKYPSQDLKGTGTFDEIYVITNDRCGSQWEEFQKRADGASLMYTKWPQLNARQVSLHSPPVPIAQEVVKGIASQRKSELSILKRQVSYLDAHRRLWKRVMDVGQQRVLVIDETLFPTTRLLRSLPSVMTNVDQESVARQRPWHVVLLRRERLTSRPRRTQSSEREQTWTMNSRYHHAVVRANVSVGVGAYVLSLDGAQFLSRRIETFRAPLDVQVGLLLRRDLGFVALSACNNDNPKPFCPEMITEIFHGSQSMLDCVWRRMQERRSAAVFSEYLRR